LPIVWGRARARGEGVKFFMGGGGLVRHAGRRGGARTTGLRSAPCRFPHALGLWLVFDHGSRSGVWAERAVRGTGCPLMSRRREKGEWKSGLSRLAGLSLHLSLSLLFSSRRASRSPLSHTTHTHSTLTNRPRAPSCASRLTTFHHPRSPPLDRSLRVRERTREREREREREQGTPHHPSAR
jgi:hypothetical protein